MLDETDLKELVEAASTKVNLNQSALLKDFYVTKALHAITKVKNDYYSLIFQGGTSLSKGYKVLKRLSENVDFRVIQKPAVIKLKKSSQRNKLRNFRLH